MKSVNRIVLLAGIVGCSLLAVAQQHPQWRANVSCAPDTLLIKKSFRVRRISGIVKDSAGFTIAPPAHVFVELAGKLNSPTFETQADSDGRFLFPAVADGEYRFRAGMKEPGFACSEGTVVVSTHAPSNLSVQVTLYPGK